MLTASWLLLSLAVSVLDSYTPVSCPQGHKCQLALLSGNDVLLQCPFPGTQWHFYSSLSKGNQVMNPSRFSNIEITSEGSLGITSPLPSQTGLYHCWNKNTAQMIQFEIDFQNVYSLHITHRSLDDLPLQNESLRVGGSQVIFTRWEPWQDCDRCGEPGERKRLGYCYVEEPLEDPVPCGIYLGESLSWSTRVKPELQVEACFVVCKDKPFERSGYVTFDNFKFNEEMESLWLRCPSASIYRPVSWEADNIPLTWKDELSGKNFNTTLELHTGGRRLQIFQPAIYRCFVEQEFIAQYNPLTSLRLPGPWTRENKAQNPPGKVDSVPLRMKLVLLMGTVLALGLLLFNTFCSAPGKNRNRTLLVK